MSPLFTVRRSNERAKVPFGFRAVQNEQPNERLRQLDPLKGMIAGRAALTRDNVGGMRVGGLFKTSLF